MSSEHFPGIESAEVRLLQEDRDERLRSLVADADNRADVVDALNEWARASKLEWSGLDTVEAAEKRAIYAEIEAVTTTPPLCCDYCTEATDHDTSAHHNYFRSVSLATQRAAAGDSQGLGYWSAVTRKLLNEAREALAQAGEQA